MTDWEAIRDQPLLTDGQIVNLPGVFLGHLDLTYRGELEGGLIISVKPDFKNPELSSLEEDLRDLKTQLFMPGLFSVSEIEDLRKRYFHEHRELLSGVFEYDLNSSGLAGYTGIIVKSV